MKFCCSLSFVNPDHFLEVAPIAEEAGWDTLVLSDHVLDSRVARGRYHRERCQRRESASRQGTPLPAPRAGHRDAGSSARGSGSNPAARAWVMMLSWKTRSLNNHKNK